jgi:nucleoside-diphosphate-sugar epimerase
MITKRVVLAGGSGFLGTALAHELLEGACRDDQACTEEELKSFVKLVCAGRRDEIVGAHIVGIACG